MTVSITPGFWNSLEDPAAFPGTMGALRVAVDDLVVTRGHEPAAPYDELYDARGDTVEQPLEEFAGEFLEFSVSRLTTAVEPFLRGDAERHTEYTALMVGEPGSTYVVLSRIDAGDHVRVAASSYWEDYASHLPLETQIGAACDPVDIARELIDVREAFVEHAERAFADHEPDLSDEIEEYREHQRSEIDELRRLIDEADTE